MKFRQKEELPGSYIHMVIGLIRGTVRLTVRFRVWDSLQVPVAIQIGIG